MHRLIAILCALLAPIADAGLPYPSLEFLFDVNDAGGKGHGYVITEAVENFPTFAQKAVKMCARGPWAVYSEPKFGGNPVSSTVRSYPIRGTGPADCTQGSVEPIISRIRSVKPLSIAPPPPVSLRPRPSDSFEYFEQKKFIGPGRRVDLLGQDGVPAVSFYRIKSFASYLDNKHQIVCNETRADGSCVYSVCLSLDKKSYIVPDLAKFPVSSPLYNIASIRTTSDDDECADVGVAPETKVIRKGIIANKNLESIMMEY